MLLSVSHQLTGINLCPLGDSIEPFLASVVRRFEAQFRAYVRASAPRRGAGMIEIDEIAVSEESSVAFEERRGVSPWVDPRRAAVRLHVHSRAGAAAGATSLRGRATSCCRRSTPGSRPRDSDIRGRVSALPDAVNVTIDGTPVTVPAGTLLVEAAKTIDTDVPVYCYHPKLGPAGLCRICLVEVEKMPKLQIACNTPVHRRHGRAHVR